MSVQIANDIRPAELPMYCSACGCQDREKQHVDFDAGCDRGYGGEGAVKVAMEDLILCESCLRAGAALVGMVDDQEPGRRITQLEQQLADEKLRADKAVAYADRMEAAIEARPEPLKVQRPRGRPRKPKQPKEATA